MFKAGILPICGCVCTTVWMHHLNANETHEEEIRRELCKNTTSCFEQILEATFHKTAVLTLLTPYITNHTSKTNKNV